MAGDGDLFKTHFLSAVALSWQMLAGWDTTQNATIDLKEMVG